VAFVRTKLLLVDDDPDLQDILQICLRQWGFQVASATNGEEGRRLAESYHPDIVLSDVMMPGTSGIALPRNSYDRLLNRGYGGSGDQRRRDRSPHETTGLSQTEVDLRSNPAGFEVPQEIQRLSSQLATAANAN